MSGLRCGAGCKVLNVPPSENDESLPFRLILTVVAIELRLRLPTSVEGYNEVHLGANHIAEMFHLFYILTNMRVHLILVLEPPFRRN